MEKISFYTLDEVKDKQLGKIGTPHRDQYEAELNSFLMGEAIKKSTFGKAFDARGTWKNDWC